MARSFKSLEDYRRHIRNKWGLGEGGNYKPWFTVRDVKSKNAFRKEVFGLKTSRVHHLLSSLEAQLFYILEFRNDVIDLREQFPLLPLSLSERIARAAGLRHPQVVGSNTPFLMTTDILITLNDGSSDYYVAICVKPKEYLLKEDVLEKIEIERIWWESLEVPFYIFTEGEANEILSRNIAWATDPVRASTANELDPLLEDSLSIIQLGKQFKTELCDSLVSAFGIEPVRALNVLRCLIAKKYISVDMSYLIEESAIIDVLNVSKDYKGVSNGN